MIDVFNGDCMVVLKQLADNSVDSVVTDPPYGISFMNKHWDYDVPKVEVWQEVLRVLKPGGHILCACGTRTQHRMTVNIEDAGFEIRDVIAWIYGSGFPKSLNIGKAVDAIGGQSLSWFIDYILNVADEKGIGRKELTMLFPSKNGNPTGWLWNKQKTQGITIEQFNRIKDFLQLPFENIEETKREIIGRGNAGLTAGTIANFSGEKEFDLTKGNSEYEGWGTALKPAMELWTLARKPLSEKTIAENVLKHGTGGINIDECRIETEDGLNGGAYSGGTRPSQFMNGGLFRKEKDEFIQPQGRFPANVIHDGSDEVMNQFPNTKSGAMSPNDVCQNTSWINALTPNYQRQTRNADSGSASRFFYCAKASKSERNKGIDGNTEKTIGHNRFDKCVNCGGFILQNPDRPSACHCETPERQDNHVKGNHHPTVKPVALMRYLCRLITPPNGTVLDPFMGSGSTGIGAKLEGFSFVGIEKEEEYCKIARARIGAWEEEKTLKEIINEPTLF